MATSHTIRSRDGKEVYIKNLTRTKAIKLMCTECCGHGEMHPKDCTSKLCPLYLYRGKCMAAYNIKKKGK